MVSNSYHLRKRGQREIICFFCIYFQNNIISGMHVLFQRDNWENVSKNDSLVIEKITINTEPATNTLIFSGGMLTRL